MAKLPAIMLYPADWLLDEVSGCSLAAQGLWLRLMFLMHSSSRYGYLVNADGSPIPPDALARRCGCSLEQYETLLIELDGIDKMGRTEEDIRFSRRMVRDEQKRSNDRKRQNDHRERVKRDVTGDVTAKSRKVSRPSHGAITSSVSSSNKTLVDKSTEGTIHVKCRDLVHAYWKRFHPSDDLAPWDGQAGKKLATFLSANPRLTEAGFKRLLDCRAESEVNHSDPPADWLPKLIKFAGGPLDRYGKPLQPAKPIAPQIRTMTREEAAAR